MKFLVLRIILLVLVMQQVVARPSLSRGKSDQSPAPEQEQGRQHGNDVSAEEQTKHRVGYHTTLQEATRNAINPLLERFRTSVEKRDTLAQFQDHDIGRSEAAIERLLEVTRNAINPLLARFRTPVGKLDILNMLAQLQEYDSGRFKAAIEKLREVTRTPINPLLERFRTPAEKTDMLAQLQEQ